VTLSGGLVDRLAGLSANAEEADDGLTYTVEVTVVCTVSASSSAGGYDADDGFGWTVTMMVVVTWVVL
jgi:hypothetical protein